MGKKNYDEKSVCALLSRKMPSVKVNMHMKTIEVDKNAINVGIHTWGKIDYLVHYHGYVQLWFTSKKKEDVEDKKDGKKKEGKAANGKKAFAKKPKVKE